MAHYIEWLPTNRNEQLAMAKNWAAVVAQNAAAWKIPPDAATDLTKLTSAAEGAFATAKNEETRTPVATAKCSAAFAELVAFMRDMKRRYFITPPLTDADIVSLGLKIPDRTHTPSGTPTAQATAETYLVGRHELGIKIIYVTGNPADSANKGYRIYYKVAAQGEPPPTSPEELTKSFFTKRKKDVIPFDYSDSGKTAYFAIQIENDGKKGPWGNELISALIP